MTTEKYDKLVLSPGAAPIRPPLPGIDLPGIFSVRTVPDAREIREWIERGGSDLTEEHTSSGFQPLDKEKRAVVVGGGYIGLEMAENLAHRGLEVTIVEMLDQVMAPLDSECARLVERHLEKNGVRLALSDAVAGFKQTANGSLEVLTKSGKVHPADMVILAIGVRPETALAKTAGIEIGKLGGIRVDEQMHTSDPDIFAVGDAVEVKDFITGEWSLIPLAGPANRQGRIVADVIAGRNSRFRGTQGTSVIGIFGATVATTGVNEKLLTRMGQKDYEKVYLFPNSHAGYYPGAKTIVLKVIFRKSDGRLLGAQALGMDGVEKRIDALAMAIQMGATVYDLEEAELCYAPPFGSAKDPVNFAGWCLPMSFGATCRFVTGTPWATGSSLTCATRRNWPWKPWRARSTYRCRNSAHAWASSPGTGKFSSSAAPHSAPTTRRASFCRTGSKRKISPEACCRGR